MRSLMILILGLSLMACGDDLQKKTAPDTNGPDNNLNNETNNQASNNGTVQGTNNQTVDPNNQTNNQTVDPNNPNSNNNTNTNNQNTNNTNNTNNSNNTNNTNNGTIVVDPDVCILVDPLSINFGDIPVGSTARAVVTIENCSSERNKTLLIDSVTAAGNRFVASAPLATEVPYGLLTSFAVEFKPTSGLGYSSQIVIETNAGTRTIQLNGTGIANTTCPSAMASGRVGTTGNFSSNIAAIPLDTVNLSAAGSMGSGGTLSYEWSVLERPTGSNVRLSPNSTVMNPSVFIDLAGSYRFELRVYENGVETCVPAYVFVRATADEDVHVQLVWDTPMDPDSTDAFGTDMDVHYKRSTGTWNLEPGDIFWRNPTADWGNMGSADDPSLDIDDTDGFGPENVNHNNPTSDTYSIGVHYYNDNGFGASTATVRIYLNGALETERTKILQTSGQFWHAADLQFPSQTLTFPDTVMNGFPTSP